MKKLTAFITTIALVLTMAGQVFAAPAADEEAKIAVSAERTEGAETSADAKGAADAADAEDTDGAADLPGTESADADASEEKPAAEADSDITDEEDAGSEDAEEISGVIDLDLMQEGAIPAGEAGAQAIVDGSGVSLSDYVEAAIENREEILDLSDFGLQPEEAAAAISEIINNNPRFFFLSGEDLPVTYDAETGVVSDVGLIYTMDEAEISSRERIIDDEIAAIRAYVARAPEGELDRVLAIHEYFALNFCYDNMDAEDDYISDVPGLFLYRQGVCQAFALAFRLVAGELGIESGYASGYPRAGANGHAWNAVMVDGSWYMIDTTWDSQSGMAGVSSHAQLLKSAQRFGHTYYMQYNYVQTYEGEAADTSYDDYWWDGVSGRSAVNAYEGSWYYCAGGTVWSRSSAYADAELIPVAESTDEIAIGEACTVYNGKIFFSGAGAEDDGCCNIYSVLPDGTELSLEYSDPDGEEIVTLGDLYGALCYGKYFLSEGSNDLGSNIPVALTDSPYVYVSEVSVSPSDITLTEDSVQLEAEITPENATDTAVYWKSSDHSVAEVDENGLVTAVGAGTAVITAVTRSGNHRTSAKVTVPNASDIESHSVFVSESSETEAMLFWTPAENAEKYYIYRIEDDGNSQTGYRFNDFKLLSVVTDEYSYELVRDTADETSMYCVIAAGENGRRKYSSYVTWKAGADAVKEADLRQGTVSFKVGGITPLATDSVKLTFTDTGADLYRVYKADIDSFGEMVSGTAVTYALSDKGASVDGLAKDGGELKARVFSIEPGGGAIFFIEAYKNTEKGAVSVSNLSEPFIYFPDNGIFLSDSAIELCVGESVPVTAFDISDCSAVDPAELKWATSDKTKGILTVDENGVLSAPGEGLTEDAEFSLYVYTKDKAYGALCKVTVRYIRTEGISLNKKTLTVSAGSSSTLKASVYPENASDSSVIWTSKKPSIAKVSAKGKVTGVKAGTTYVYAQTNDGNFTAKCKIVVTQSVTGVKINKTELELLKGKVYTLKATVAPTNATNKNVKWTSSNPSVATVTSTGKITAKKAGKATITVTTVDGSFKAKCKVTVTAK